MKVGVIAFAFGQARGERVTRSNRYIAKAAINVASIYDAPIVTQWEVAIALESRPVPVEVVSEYDPSAPYVTTKDAFMEAVRRLAKYGVTHVALVGHPDHVAVVRLFVRWHIWHLNPDMQLFRHAVVDRFNQTVPYDRTRMNIQRWTRSRARFRWHLVKLAFGRRHGH